MKTLQKFLFALLGVAVFAAMAPALLADPITVGGVGSNPGDWTQQWQETGEGSVTSILAFLETPGVTFADTGLNNFSDASWTGMLTSPMSASAAGSANSDLYFNTDFTTASSVPLTLDLYGFDNGVLNDDATAATWNGSSWSYASLNAGNLANETPEPATLALMGGGLLLLGLAFRKRISIPDGAGQYLA